MTSVSVKRNPIAKIIVLIRSELQKELLTSKIANLPVDEDNPIQIVISEQTKARGLDANAYYWLRLGEVSAQAWSAGRQYQSDIWHEYCKRNIMSDIVEIKSGDMVSKYMDSPDGNAVIISTTQLSKKQFAEYTEAVEAFGCSLGVMFSANPKII